MRIQKHFKSNNQRVKRLDLSELTSRRQIQISRDDEEYDEHSLEVRIRGKNNTFTTKKATVFSTLE